MSGVSSSSNSVCRECGATNPSGAKDCWLCKAKLEGSSEKPIQATLAPEPPPIPANVNRTYSLSTLFLIMTVAAVCFGVIGAAPGLGIFLTLFMLPPLVRTAMVVRRKEEMGEHVSTGKKIALGASSFLVCIIFATIVTVASVGTFCAVCLGVVSSANNQSMASAEVAIPVAGLAAVGATVLVILFMARLIRARWRWDTRPDKK